MAIGNFFTAVYSAGTAIAAVHMATLVGQGDLSTTMKAVGEFGIAIVIATASFVGMAWYLKYHLMHQQKQADKAIENQREDVNRMAARISELETLVVELNRDYAKLHVTSLEVSRANADAIDGLTRALQGRACVAMSRLTPDQRAQVEKIFEG